MDSVLSFLMERKEALTTAFWICFFAKYSTTYASIYSCPIHASISFNKSSVPIKALITVNHLWILTCKRYFVSLHVVPLCSFFCFFFKLGALLFLNVSALLVLLILLCRGSSPPPLQSFLTILDGILSLFILPEYEHCSIFVSITLVSPVFTENSQPLPELKQSLVQIDLQISTSSWPLF